MRGEFRHRPVLLNEVLEALAIRPDGTYVDGTFGRGGHSRSILQALGDKGRLIALDKDPSAVTQATAIQDPRFTIVHSGFVHLRQVLERLGVVRVDGVLLDLGVSSPQLEDAVRGFSFRREGPLDMRMDTSSGRTAAEWLDSATQDQIAKVVKEYGEERFAKQIARAIIAARAHAPVVTTGQLAAIVAKAVRTREPHQDPATRTFQAIRIYLNQEIEELSLVLPQCVEVLARGGRLVVIAFHSLEDRVVKRFMREASRPEALPGKLPLRECEIPAPRLNRVGKPVRPSVEEVAANPRARSAVMRVAQRTEAAWRG